MATKLGLLHQHELFTTILQECGLQQEALSTGQRELLEDINGFQELDRPEVFYDSRRNDSGLRFVAESIGRGTAIISLGLTTPKSHVEVQCGYIHGNKLSWILCTPGDDDVELDEPEGLREIRKLLNYFTNIRKRASK